MKRSHFAWIAVFSAVCATQARAGLVGFDPGIVAATPGTPINVDVTVDTALFSDVQQATLIIGSFSDLAFAGFTYDSSFAATFGPDVFLPDYTPGIYTSQLRVGGDAFPTSVSFPGPSIPIGSFFIDTTTLAPGIYSVGVNYEVDFESQVVDPTGSEGEPVQDHLEGFFEFEITPEPASLVLLAMGGMVLARRAR
jgi:hypothetical protein